MAYCKFTDIIDTVLDDELEELSEEEFNHGSADDQQEQINSDGTLNPDAEYSNGENGVPEPDLGEQDY